MFRKTPTPLTAWVSRELGLTALPEMASAAAIGGVSALWSPCRSYPSCEFSTWVEAAPPAAAQGAAAAAGAAQRINQWRVVTGAAIAAPLRAPPCAGPSLQSRHFASAAAASTATADHVEGLLDAIVRPNSDQQAALRELFRDFDGEAIIQASGVLGSLEPHVHRVLNDLSITFREAANSFSVKQCANILSTMVLLGHYDTDLKDAIVDRVLQDINAADPEALGCMCYCIGVAGYFDRMFFKAMEEMVTEHAEKFSCRALSKCLWMFSRLGYENENVDRALGALVGRILADENTVPQDLAYVLWACSDNEEYADQVAYRIMSNPPEQVSDFPATVLAKLAHGLSKQQVNDPDMYNAIAARTTDIAPDFFPRDLAKLLWAFGNVGIVVPEMIHALEPCILQHLKKFTHNELDMIVTSYNNFGIHSSIVVKLANRMSHFYD